MRIRNQLTDHLVGPIHINVCNIKICTTRHRTQEKGTVWESWTRRAYRVHEKWILSILNFIWWNINHLNLHIMKVHEQFPYKQLDALFTKKRSNKEHYSTTGMSNCKLFDVANLSTSSWSTSFFTSILVATFERAERYTITHATSVANSSSLNFK